ncbi:unnamed protein product [Boreogadus saida]
MAGELNTLSKIGLGLKRRFERYGFTTPHNITLWPGKKKEEKKKEDNADYLFDRRRGAGNTERSAVKSDTGLGRNVEIMMVKVSACYGRTTR